MNSDHMVIEINLDLKILPTCKTRVNIYNFKNQQGRDNFNRLTSETNRFTECFKTMQPLLIQCEDWKNTLSSYCKKAFPIIRVRTRQIKPSAADSLIGERNSLKRLQEQDMTNKVYEAQINLLEKTISDIIAEEEMYKINQFKKFSVIYGSVNVSEMWKLKKKLWPKKCQSIPTGKLNHQGKLISAPEDLKQLLQKEYGERLRRRPQHPNLENVKEVKNEAFKVKMAEAKNNQSQDWSMLDLENVLKDIKHNKSRDIDGLNRNIFHLNCIGNDLKQSLLVMFNKLKNHGEIPNFMKKAVISTIPKPGSKFLLKNERGIFILSAVRTLMMRLIYNTKYNIIDQNMSDSNVGGRKNRSCINHIFVINGIIHETVKSKNNSPVTIQIYDYKQMFDSMNLQEAVSYLFDSVKNNNLALLYEAN